MSKMNRREVLGTLGKAAAIENCRGRRTGHKHQFQQ